jgi:hypothetical protein
VIDYHPDQITLVLPPKKSAQGRELSESDLEAIAGGGPSPTQTVEIPRTVETPRTVEIPRTVETP